MISGKDLKKAIKSLDITQQEAADKIGVSRQTVVTWTGKSILDDQICQIVKDKLGVDLHELKGDSARDGLKLPEATPLFNNPYADKLIDRLEKEIQNRDKQIEDKNKEIERIINHTDKIILRTEQSLRLTEERIQEYEKKISTDVPGMGTAKRSHPQTGREKR